MASMYELCYMVLIDAEKEGITGRAARIVKNELNKIKSAIEIAQKYQEDTTSDDELVSRVARCKVQSAWEETNDRIMKFHRYWWIYKGYSLSDCEIRALAYTWIEFTNERDK